MKGIKGKLIVAIVLVVFVGLGGFWIYVAVRTYPADAGALDRIRSDDRISIHEERDHFRLAPPEGDGERPPLIFYPGGLVEPEAYLFKMGRVAGALGATVFVIKPPFNAAIFDVGAAGRLMDHYGIGEAWIGGHSLGGIAACRFASANAERAHGLFLFGSYCDVDARDLPSPIISIMGLEDRVIDRGNYEEARRRLPDSALVEEVEGMNHSAFGNYGHQRGDGQGSLDDEAVIRIIIAAFDRAP